MQIIDDIKESVTDFLHHNAKIIITVIAIILLFVLSAVVIGIVQCTQKAQIHKPVVIPKDETFTLTDDLFAPEEQPLTENYYFSRETKDNWNQDEFDQWFVKPDETTIKGLQDSNDNMIEKITGAAP